jgi:hypothetical protein
MEQSGDVKRAEENAAAAQAEIDALNDELQREVAALSLP